MTASTRKSLLQLIPSTIGWVFLAMNAAAMLGVGDSFVLVDASGVYFSWVIGR